MNYSYCNSIDFDWTAEFMCDIQQYAKQRRRQSQMSVIDLKAILLQF